MSYKSSFLFFGPGSNWQQCHHMCVFYVAAAALAQGRMKLVNAHKGQRYKLKTRDMNEIDTMFVDRRNSNR